MTQELTMEADAQCSLETDNDRTQLKWVVTPVAEGYLAEVHLKRFFNEALPIYGFSHTFGEALAVRFCALKRKQLDGYIIEETAVDGAPAENYLMPLYAIDGIAQFLAWVCGNQVPSKKKVKRRRQVPRTINVNFSRLSLRRFFMMPVDYMARLVSLLSRNDQYWIDCINTWMQTQPDNEKFYLSCPY
jgi:hypothetical protein